MIDKTIFTRSFLFFVFCLLLTNANAASGTLTFIGYGDNENNALADAKKVAVGKICGETILGSTNLQSDTQKTTKLSTSGENSKSINTDTKTTDNNLSLVGGSVKSYKIINKGLENGISFVEIEALVSDCKKSDEIQDGIAGNLMVSELRKINMELMKLGTSDALISNPGSIAQKYHNARILIQRGEVDRALPLYEEIVSNKLIFADPIIDLATLLTRMYGPVMASKYVDNKLAVRMPLISREYAKLLIDKKSIKDEKLLKEIEAFTKRDSNFLNSFPPFSVAYLRRLDIKEAKNKFNFETTLVLQNMVEIVKDGLDTGDYYAYFFDQTRAEGDVKSLDLSKFNVSDNLLLNKIKGEWFGANDPKYCLESPTGSNGSRHKISDEGFSWYRDDPDPLKLQKITEVKGEIIAYFSQLNSNNKEEKMCLVFKNLTKKSADVASEENSCDAINKKDTGKWYRCTFF